MRLQVLGTSAILLSFAPTSILASQIEQKFCADLTTRGIASASAFGDRLFYRATNGEPVELARIDKISRDVRVLFYYIRGDEAERGQKSVLNLKFVYKTSRPISRRQVVGLVNSQWRPANMAQIQNDCAGLTIDGYERFHLDNTRSYCLSRHFHQETPYNTLATIQQRESFAFRDMLQTQPSGFLQSISTLLIPSAKATEPGQISTVQGTLARSWIWNFDYGTSVSGVCISVKPDFPDDATSLSLRITNHGINFTPHPRDWNLTFVD